MLLRNFKIAYNWILWRLGFSVYCSRCRACGEGWIDFDGGVSGCCSPKMCDGGFGCVHYYDDVDWTEEEYLKAMEVITELWDAEPNTRDGDYLNRLIMQVGRYEAKHYPMTKPRLKAKLEYYLYKRGILK